MLVTRPVVSTNASICTLPPRRCDLAISGKTGGTDEISLAALTSPPMGRGIVGATGCFDLEPNTPEDNPAVAGTWLDPSRFNPSSGVACAAAGLFTMGAERLTSPSIGFFARGAGAGAAEATFVATSLVFRLAFTGSGRLDGLPDTPPDPLADDAPVVPVVAGTGAVVVIVPEGFDGEGADTCGDCAVCKEPAFSATVFCAGVERSAGGPPAVWRMYQAPPPISNSKPAAIPMIKPFLLELPVLVERVSNSSVNRRLPNDGAGTAALADSGTAEISVMARSGSSKPSW